MVDPVQFTTTTYADRKVADARSVLVAITASGVDLSIKPGVCRYVAPYLGILNEAVELSDGESGTYSLEIGPIRIATTKLTSGQTFAAGTKVYFDASTQLFTETPGDIPAGWVYKAKGSESTPVAHIFLLPPVFEPIDLTDLAAIKAAFADIDLDDFGDAVFSDINAVTEALADAELEDIAGFSKQAHIADVTDVAGVDAAALVTDINKAGGIKATINAILKSLEDAGIHATT